MDSYPINNLVLNVNKKLITNFYNVILNAFTKNQSFLLKGENIFCQNFLSLMLNNNDEHIINMEKDDDFIKNYNLKDGKLIFQSYPKHNFLLLLSNNILLSFVNKKFMFEFFKFEVFKDNSEVYVQMINSYIKDNEENISKLLIYIENTSEIESDIENFLIDFFLHIQQRGLLTFLGIRKTVGSLDSYLPPVSELLKNNFTNLNKTEIKINVKTKLSVLTVGARALCKHSHRCSEQFWPTAKGSEKEKNIKAEEILNKFLDECVWINIHGLPGDIPIIELRVDQGYGIRWQIDGVFRGFLEPQFEGGHEVGWKH